MNTKWHLLMVVALLAALVGGNNGAAMAQEIHYFTLDPTAPQEGGGTVTFTATPPEGYASLEWSRSTDPGSEGCDLTIASAGGLTASTDLLKSGVYQVCLHITFSDGLTPEIIDSQPVTVTNLPPTLGDAKMKPAVTLAGYPVSASVPVTDYDSSLTCEVDFGDGTDPVAGILNGSCTALHTYAAEGTYTVTFKVTESGFDPVTATASHTVVPPYAYSVYTASDTVQDPEAATGAQDGLFAYIRTDSSLMLDLGVPVQGATLTIYHSTRSPSCGVLIESTNAAVGSTVAGADRTILSFPASLPEFQHVGIQCGTLSKKAVFQLDAIQVEPAPPPDGYAGFAMGFAGEVQNAGAAVGAPDDNYATIGAAGGEIMLEMGEPLQGILTIYHSADSPSCGVLLDWDYQLGSTVPGATSTSLIVPFIPSGGIEIPSYFSVDCTGADNAVFELDAVQMRPTIEPTGYALATFGYGVESAGAATGEPDGQYALMAGTSNSSQLLLDMGDVVQGTILTIYHSSVNESCTVALASVVQSEELQPLGITTAGGESSTFEISQDFRYVWIDCVFSAVPWDVFGLDAVHVGTAADLSGYAVSTSDVLGSVQNAGAAVGAPDKEYATLIDGGGGLVLDLGAPMQGMLTIYHSAESAACEVAASLALTDPPEPDVMLGITRTGTESTALFIGEDNRYVWISCSPAAGEVVELDAIHVDQSVSPTGYALTALGSSDIQNLDAAVGAPDGKYATMTQLGTIVLDLGAVHQGVLTVYLGQAGGLCDFQGTTTFFGESVILEQTGSAPATFSLPTEGIRYVVINCSLAAGDVFELDAIHASPAPNGYGLQVLGASDDVQNAAAATGAPDSAYATVTAENGGIVLDMGELMQGILTVYHSSTSATCFVYATDTFSPPDGQSVPVGGTLLGVEESNFSVTTDSQYVWVMCPMLPRKAVFALDAVQIQPGTITPTGNGIGVVTASSDVRNPLEAIGAPNDQYATITAATGAIWLDLGALIQGPLTIYHSSTSPSCAVALTDIIGGEVATIGATTAGATSTEFAPAGQYRYVMVACTTLAKRSVFQLDAVQVTLPPP